MIVRCEEDTMGHNRLRRFSAAVARRTLAILRMEITTEDVPLRVSAAAPAILERTCWFCRNPGIPNVELVAPGGQHVWLVCRGCAVEAVAALVLRGALTASDILGTCTEAIRAHREAAVSAANATTTTLDAIASNIHRDSATFAGDRAPDDGDADAEPRDAKHRAPAPKPKT